jgi:transposase
MTKRLAQWMGKQAIKRTFASIAEEVGCTEFTVRSVFSDYVNELEKTIRFETPKWMGIDEIHLIKPRGVIANIQNNTIVELLPNRNKDTVVRFLHHLEGKERIQYVAMDMWTPYRDAVRAVIPQAEIVVDKFHVVRMANEAMERVRKNLRESLTPKQRPRSDARPLCSAEAGTRPERQGTAKPRWLDEELLGAWRSLPAQGAFLWYLRCRVAR